MRKIVFSKDGMVASVSVIYDTGVNLVSNIDNAEQHEVDLNTDVKEGDLVNKDESGNVSFSKP